MRLNSIIVIIGLTLLSCNSTNHSKNEIALQKADSTIHLNIHSFMSSTTRNIRYFNDNKIEYLAVENEHKEQIEVFNLKTNEFIKTIKPQREGPNGIGSRLFGFDIVNFDTIIITTSGRGETFFIIDSSVRIKNKIDFEISYKPYLPIGQLWSSYGRTSNYDGEKLILSNVSRATDEDFKQIHNCSIGYYYIFKTNETQDYPLNHPDKSKQKDEILNSEGAIIVNGDKVVLSYPMGHQVFVSEKNGDWETYNLKSKYLKNAFSDAYADDVLESMTKYVKSSCYLALVYDKYRKVYYRFVYPGIDVTRQDDVMKLGEFRRVFSVMIIDEDFNVLGETLMPENTYNSNMFFINEAGLWISTNHPENPDFDEDAINFQLFTLK